MKRIDWIDVAKGLAIILIVMFHSRDYALSLIPPSPDYPIRWSSIDPLLRYIRLPLFFVVSGMLASGMLAAHGGTPRYNGRRAVSLAATYLLWSIPLLIIIPYWPRDEWRIPANLDFAFDLLRGGSVIWYPWALTLTFGFAYATRKLPPLAAIMLATATGVILLLYRDALGGSMGPLGRCLPYYILGIRYPLPLLWLARWRSPVGLALLASAYMIGLALLPDVAGLNALREIVGISLAVVAIGWGTECWPRAARRLAWLGRRTLPVYIFHFPLLAIIGSAAVRHGQPLAAWPITIWIFLPLLSGTVIALSLGLFFLLRAMGLGWTMAMPKGHRPTAGQPRPPIPATA